MREFLFTLGRQLAVVMLAIGLNAPVSNAAPISGARAPEFQKALLLWLQDNEVDALPELSRLAHDGNMAARVLVGLIDKHFPLQGPWLALLPKDKRIGLLRIKGGLSGISWLRQAEGVPPLAVWLKILDDRANIEMALSLVSLDEPRLARAALVSLESRQFTGFAAYADDPRFPAEVRYLVWREWQKADRLDELAAALNALPKGDPQRGLLSRVHGAFDLQNWLQNSSLALPLKALCRDACADSQGACLQAGLFTLGGYRRYATQGTPLAALISEKEFAESPRGQRSVLRRALGFAFMTENRLKPIVKIDACFARLLEDEAQKF